MDGVRDGEKKSARAQRKELPARECIRSAAGPSHNHFPTRLNLPSSSPPPRQVCTGDSWATSVVRAMFYDEGKVEPLPTIFFVSYMLVASVVLINIVIAVLLVCLSSLSLLALFSRSLALTRLHILTYTCGRVTHGQDEFLTTMARSRQEQNQESVVGSNSILEESFMDPLLAVLSKYRSLEDLAESISIIFSRLDVDGSGGVGFAEMRDGLPRLLSMNRYFSIEDWCEICEEVVPPGTKTEEIELDLELFQCMLLTQLKSYMLRQANKALIGGDQPYESIILVLKWLMTFDESADQNEGIPSSPGKGSRRDRPISQVPDLDQVAVLGGASTGAVSSLIAAVPRASAESPGRELGSNPPESAGERGSERGTPGKDAAEETPKNMFSHFRKTQISSRRLSVRSGFSCARSPMEPTAANAGASCEGCGCAGNAELTQRLDRLEHVMLSNMARVHEQLALLIDIQAPSMAARKGEEKATLNEATQHPQQASSAKEASSPPPRSTSLAAHSLLSYSQHHARASQAIIPTTALATTPPTTPRSLQMDLDQQLASAQAFQGNTIQNGTTETARPNISTSPSTQHNPSAAAFSPNFSPNGFCCTYFLLCFSKSPPSPELHTQ